MNAIFTIGLTILAIWTVVGIEVMDKAREFNFRTFIAIGPILSSIVFFMYVSEALAKWVNKK